MSVRACAISRSRRCPTFIVDAFEALLSLSEYEFSLSNGCSVVNSDRLVSRIAPGSCRTRVARVSQIDALRSFVRDFSARDA
jgi:hypothetical protein